MDHIHIRDLGARCIIGTGPDERRDKQEVVINLTLSADLDRAARGDDAHPSLDYRTVTKQVLALVEASQFRLLEALASAIADACLEHPLVLQVKVTLDKPGALRFARSVAVELVRHRR